ncbi:MAG TPA: RNA 3'-terminal phosphate cyclase [Pyrinomonadaceae bacterium]
MIIIDGSFGEGGGQIIRTSLALSLITGKPFRVMNVRARRDRPGLQRQHLTAVNAAATVGAARVEGAAIGAREFTFVPGEVTAGEYSFPTGTAGSTTLVAQAILPPLMLAAAPSVVTLEGGTHNVHAPPFEFLEKTFVPLVNRTGAGVSVELVRYGFYPPGGGRLDVLIEPRAVARRLDITELGGVRRAGARALVVKLAPSVGERALEVVRRKLGWEGDALRLELSQDALSPNVVLTLEVESEHLTEVFTGVGERGVRVETIAERVCDEAARYLEIGAPVGAHLADQLLIPLALSGGGSYITGPLSLHTTTNIEIVKKFLPVEITASHLSNELWKVEVFA